MTTLKLYQQGQFGPRQQRDACADHSRKHCILYTPATCQAMLECSQAKVAHYWQFSDNSDSTIDLTWALVRMLPAQLFHVEPCPVEAD